MVNKLLNEITISELETIISIVLNIPNSKRPNIYKLLIAATFT